MRNLKRALSLTLASVMLLGMMVVGAGAAGFPDVADDNDNVEAIEVLQAIEVMVGNADTGNFEPDRSVTRTEMAVVMANLLKLDYKYYEASCPFWDVPTWAKSYVGACYANKITSGYGDGTYGALDPITPVQAASMMMRALGYFQYSEDYKDGFETATVRQGTQIGIFDGIGSSADKDMTRGQVARMALNALRSEMVTFTGTPGTTYTTSTGDSLVIGYVAKYEPRTSTEEKYNAIEGRTSDVASDYNHKGQYYIQLGEELYNGDLRLKSADDDFGRPCRRWEYKSDIIGLYVREELIRQEYTAQVNGKTLYDLLGSSLLKEYDTDIYVDGVDVSSTNAQSYLGSAYHTVADLNRNNDTKVFATGNGTLTQVFVDNPNKEITISVINTYLAISDEDYNERAEDVDVLVYGIGSPARDIYVKTKTSANDYAPFKLVKEDFPLIENLKDGDPLLVTVAAGVVQTAAVPEVMSGITISAFSQGSSLTTDGTKYNYSSAAEYDWEVLDVYTGINGTVNLKDIQYNVYLDKYGYAIGVDIVEAVNNYVFITAINRGGSHLTNTTADVNAIFMDGTMDTIRVNMNKSTLSQLGAGKNAILNTWCTYSKDSNDLYTVKEVSRATQAPADTLLNVENDYPAYVPGGANNANGRGKIAQSWTAPNAGFDIDRSHLSLNGGGNTGDGYSRVYGNDNTVYLTAKLDEVDHDNNSGTGNYGAISGVSSVVTGVRNADLKVWDMATANKRAEKTAINGAIPVNDPEYQSYGVYALYGRDGYVIAAVVVGENGASNRNLVYVDTNSLKEEIDNGKSENRAAGDGKYTWTREAILNGERTLLTEVGDEITYLDKLQQYNWYQISYNTDGEVIGVAHVTAGYPDGNNVVTQWELDGEHLNGDSEWVGEYINHIEYLEDSLDDYDVVLYSESFTNDRPYMDTNKGNTLYVTHERRQGVWVTDDVNVALVEWRDNARHVEFRTGVNQLRNIVRTLNEKSGFNYTISAVVTGTGATSVIICDWTNMYDRPVVSQNRELKLYGTLFTGKDVTGKGNAVVTANEGAVAPEGTGTDAYGSYTLYRIRSGDRVVINDLDINTGATIMSNLDDQRWPVSRSNGRHTLGFTMPDWTYAVRIFGSDDVIQEDITAEVDTDANPSLGNFDFELGGADAQLGGTIADAKPGDVVTGKAANRGELRAISELVEGEWYIITLGAYNTKTTPAQYKVQEDGGKYIAFSYTLTAEDIFNGFVEIKDIEKYTEEVKSYDITIGNVTGGTVTADKETAKVGETVTLTAVPTEEGFVVEYTVTDAQGKAVTVTGDTFVMPASNVTVTATFVDPADKEYAVNIDADITGGKVEADVAEAKEGDTVTLTITPDSSMKLDTITVKDAENKDVAVTGTGNSRTFTMPASDVTVTATFVEDKVVENDPAFLAVFTGLSLPGTAPSTTKVYSHTPNTAMTADEVIGALDTALKAADAGSAYTFANYARAGESNVYTVEVTTKATGAKSTLTINISTINNESQAKPGTLFEVSYGTQKKYTIGAGGANCVFENMPSGSYMLDSAQKVAATSAFTVRNGQVTVDASGVTKDAKLVPAIKVTAVPTTLELEYNDATNGWTKVTDGNSAFTDTTEFRIKVPSSVAKDTEKTLTAGGKYVATIVGTGADFYFTDFSLSDYVVNGAVAFADSTTLYTVTINGVEQTNNIEDSEYAGTKYFAADEKIKVSDNSVFLMNTATVAAAGTNKAAQNQTTGAYEYTVASGDATANKINLYTGHKLTWENTKTVSAAKALLPDAAAGTAATSVAAAGDYVADGATVTVTALDNKTDIKVADGVTLADWTNIDPDTGKPQYTFTMPERDVLAGNIVVAYALKDKPVASKTLTSNTAKAVDTIEIEAATGSDLSKVAVSVEWDKEDSDAELYAEIISASVSGQTAEKITISLTNGEVDLPASKSGDLIIKIGGLEYKIAVTSAAS